MVIKVGGETADLTYDEVLVKGPDDVIFYTEEEEEGKENEKGSFSSISVSENNAMNSNIITPISELAGENENDLISTYFKQGYSYKEILHMLSLFHGIKLSIRQFHLILRKKSLFRKGHLSNINDLIVFIGDVLAQSGQCHGYRQMHQRCVQAGLRTTRNRVRLVY